MMKAYVMKRYAPNGEGLLLQELPIPTVTQGHVLIKVIAAGLNAADWHITNGDPYVLRLMTGVISIKPNFVPGTALSGIIEAVGPNVNDLKIGDEVFTEPGIGFLGAFGQYALVPANMISIKPNNLSLEESASLPVSSTTAYQALHTFCKIKNGDSLLINGASGGVGTAAIQIARARGAEVTAVTSTKHLELCTLLGANHTIDYTKHNFIHDDNNNNNNENNNENNKSNEVLKYDYILDLVGKDSVYECFKKLKKEGTLLASGGLGQSKGLWLGIWDDIKAKINPFRSHNIQIVMNNPSKEALENVKVLVEEGKLKPVIDKIFTFEQLPLAMKYLEEGHVAGKIIISFKDNK